MEFHSGWGPATMRLHTGPPLGGRCWAYYRISGSIGALSLPNPPVMVSVKGLSQSVSTPAPPVGKLPVMGLATICVVGAPPVAVLAVPAMAAADAAGSALLEQGFHRALRAP